MSDIVERLVEACVGHPHTQILWPHRLLHDSRDEILRMRARLEVSDSGYDGISCRDETIKNQDGIIQCLRADNAKLREAVTWRPIETAPRDGREVNVWCPSDNPGDNGGYVVPGAWWGSVLSFDEEGREIARYCWRCHGDEGVRWAHQPTHWLPLPEAPR